MVSALDVVTLGETMVLFTPNQSGYLRYAKQFSTSIAGSETNVAIGISRMGHRAGWISKVGNDEFGKSLRMFLQAEGIDLSLVKTEESAPTGLIFKEHFNEEQTRVFYYRKHSAASLLAPEDITEEYVAKAKYIFVSGIKPALSKTCREAVLHAMKLAKKHGVQVVFDPNVRKTLWDDLAEARQVFLQMARLADIVLLGTEEGKFIFNMADVHEIGAAFLTLGVKIVVVKLGEEGAHYFTADQSAHVPAFTVKRVVDPVGAGDAFAAGFITGQLEGLTVYDSVVRANAFGALVTMVEGDVEGLPERAQLLRFMESAADDVER